MATKRAAQKQAREVRKTHRRMTVNVREVSKGNFGVRFSPKGKRDKFNYRKAR